MGKGPAGRFSEKASEPTFYTTFLSKLKHFLKAEKGSERKTL
jgi:hypothetical protein